MLTQWIANPRHENTSNNNWPRKQPAKACGSTAYQNISLHHYIPPTKEVTGLIIASSPLMMGQASFPITMTVMIPAKRYVLKTTAPAWFTFHMKTDMVATGQNA